jgi:hypothetical protein
LLGYFLSQSLCSSYNRGLSVGTQYDVKYVLMLLQDNVKDEDSFRNFQRYKFMIHLCFIEEQSPAVLTIVETSFSLPKNTFTNTNNVIFVLGSK